MATANEEVGRNLLIYRYIFNYIRYTGHEDYLVRHGLDVLIGIARFWSQRVNWSEEKKKFVLLGVTGPNEYENNVNNNWYTNTIAVWCLNYTLYAKNYVKQVDTSIWKDICERLQFDEGECVRWKAIINQMLNQLTKPRLRTSQIINMSLGFLGIQIGFALQNGNASRILQTFGADIEHLSVFWLAAPLTGMIVQPLIGHYSDRTWNRLGRRRPYFLTGAVLTAVALLLMPNAAILTTVLPPLAIGAGMLMIMDASINVTMEPFRALAADNLPKEQRSKGFSIQTFLIGAGAVVGSWLPYVLAEFLGVSKLAEEGHVPPNVILSFYIGAVVLVMSILWTVITTEEYSPAELDAFDKRSGGPLELVDKKGLPSILNDLKRMPKTMKQLGLVQFFSWFALFSMWVFTTPAIAEHVYRVEIGDSSSTNFANAGNWVGVLFGIYNAVSAIYALVLPGMAKRFGQRTTHAISLSLGGLALLSIFFIRDPYLLILPMLGVGIAWASILAMPYAILSADLPANKMGVYMGIFNFFITFPQILNGLCGGYIVKYIFNGKAIYALMLAGVFMLFAALSVLRVQSTE